MPVMVSKSVSQELSEQEIKRLFIELWGFYGRTVRYLCAKRDCIQPPPRRKVYPNGRWPHTHFMYKDWKAEDHSRRTGHLVVHIDDYL